MSPKKDQEVLAEKYIKKGKYEEAIREYRKLLSGGDEDITIRNTLGDLYIKTGLNEKAIKEFRRVASHYEDKGLFAKAIALYKRITRMDPEGCDCAEKLADLFREQGFSSEAKAEYLRLIQILKEGDGEEETIRIYHKLLGMDREDMDSRLALAELYEQRDSVEQAVEELNELAEIKMASNKLAEASLLLDRAKNLQANHSRTLSNLIDLLKRERKDDEALALIQSVLKKDRDNIKTLKLYGNLLFGKQSYKKAEEVFSKVLSLKPDENSVRVRLGKIYTLEEKYDEAFALFEPLVESFLEKRRGDKAVSLLGIILQNKTIHTPTLEKLASIYKSLDNKKNLENVSKVLLNEYRKKRQEKKMLEVLKDLVRVIPEDQTYYSEYKELQKALGLVKEGEEDESFAQKEKAEEIITSNLIKADLYIEQGLVRNARRILDNLRVNFSSDPRVEKKIEELKGIDPDYDKEEIPERVEKVSEKESQLLHEEKPIEVEDLISVADIFADTDLIPFASPDGLDDSYFDLSERIDEELEVMRDIVSLQKERGISTFEKPLSEILVDFKKDIGEKLAEASHESRYHLGLAFMEQDLWDEALDELELAAQDSSLAIDCYLVMSYCYRKKKDFKEAKKRLDKALKIAEDNSSQFYSLKYEMASLFEEMEDDLKAMQIYLEIKEWKSSYRDINRRLKSLAKKIN